MLPGPLPSPPGGCLESGVGGKVAYRALQGVRGVLQRFSVPARHSLAHG